MCVLLITRLLRGVGRWARKPVNHTSWVAVVTSTDRPKSVRNRCLIELFCGVVCVFTLPFWHFRGCRGFCHRTESDLLLFVFTKIQDENSHNHATRVGMMVKCDNEIDEQTVNGKVIKIHDRKNVILSAMEQTVRYVYYTSVAYLFYLHWIIYP